MPIRPLLVALMFALAACGDKPTKDPSDTSMSVDASPDAGNNVTDRDTGGPSNIGAPDMMEVPDTPVDDVTVPDFGISEVIVAPQAITVTEGSAAPATFTVVLATQPDVEVVIAVTNPDDTLLSIDVAQLRFAPAVFDVPQTVTVTAIDDTTPSAPQPHTITLGPAMGGTYDGVAVPSVDVTIIDPDRGSISVAPTLLTTSELGTSTTFDVTLSSAPSADVIITATATAPSEGAVSGPVTLDANTLTGTFTVTGLDDGVQDGDQTYAIDLAATSADAAFDGLVITSVVVTNVDTSGPPQIAVNPVNLSLIEGLGGNATFDIVLSTDPGATVTVDVSNTTPLLAVTPSQATFDSTNFATPHTFTVTAVDDQIASGNQVITLVTTNTATGIFANVDPDDVDVLVTDNDAEGVSVNPTVVATSESGTMSTFDVVLDSEPIDDVVVTPMSSNGAEVTVSGPLTFSTSDWSVPQTVTATGVDDAVVDGNAAVTVSLSLTSNDPVYNGFVAPNVTVTNIDDDAPGFIVTPLSTQHTSESGTSITVDVSLNGPPVDNVLIPVSSNNTNEGTVAPTMLVFGPANWSIPQTITVTGVDDSVTDGPVQFAIFLDLTTSSDAAWNALDPPNFFVINDDNEPGFTVTPTSLTVSETGSRTFTVVLNAAPIANVRIDITPDASLGDEYTVAPLQAVFTPANWDTARTFTVDGIDDSMVDGPQNWAIDVRVGTTIDPSYSLDCGGNCPAQTISGTTTD